MVDPVNEPRPEARASSPEYSDPPKLLFSKAQDNLPLSNGLNLIVDEPGSIRAILKSADGNETDHTITLGRSVGFGSRAGEDLAIYVEQVEDATFLFEITDAANGVRYYAELDLANADTGEASLEAVPYDPKTDAWVSPTLLSRIDSSEQRVQAWVKLGDTSEKTLSELEELGVRNLRIYFGNPDTSMGNIPTDLRSLRTLAQHPAVKYLAPAW